jgi:hypothetical protein
LFWIFWISQPRIKSVTTWLHLWNLKNLTQELSLGGDSARLSPSRLLHQSPSLLHPFLSHWRCWELTGGTNPQIYLEGRPIYCD